MAFVLKKSNSLLLRGALTNRPAAFKSRPWELRSVYTVDLLDTLNNLVEVNIRGNDFIRILPVSSKFTTTEGAWISDRIRYAVDAFRLQRLDNPLVVLKSNTKSTFNTVSWKILFKIISSNLKFLNTAELSSKLFNVSNLNQQAPFMYLFSKKSIPLNLLARLLMERLYDVFSINSYFFFNSSVLNTTLLQTKNASSFVFTNQNRKPVCSLNLNDYSTFFIVGSELATLSPIIWSSINQLVTTKGAEAFTFSDAQPTKFSNLVSNFKHVGSVYDFKKLLCGRHWLSTKLNQNCTSTIKARKKHLIVLKVDSVNDLALLNYVNQLSSINLNFQFNVFPLFTTNTLIHDLVAGQFSELVDNLKESFKFFSQQSLVFLKDPISDCFYKKSVKKNKAQQLPFSLQLSSHATPTLRQSNMVIPTSAFFEESAYFRDLLGYLKETKRAITPPGLATEVSNFFILFYTITLKKYKKRTLFLNYLFNHLSKKLALCKSHISKLLLLKNFVKLFTDERLTLSSFIRLVLPFMYTTTIPAISINLNPVLIPDIRSTKSTIWTNTKLRSNGYLSFGDEITMHSKALLEIKKQLI